MNVLETVLDTLVVCTIFFAILGVIHWLEKRRVRKIVEQVKARGAKHIRL